jgi:hypothetical protein
MPTNLTHISLQLFREGIVKELRYPSLLFLFVVGVGRLLL